MPIADPSLDEFRKYKPELTRRDDFLSFCEENIKQAKTNL